MHFPRMATSNSAIALATLLALILSAFYWPYPSPQPGHVVERSGYEEIDDFAGNSTFHSLASRAPPAYTPENYFNFINFENAFVKAADGSDFSMKDDYEKKVKQSILEIPQTPSFLRYFRATTGDATNVAKVIPAIAIATGCPGERFEAMRASGRCHFNKIDIYYDTPDPSIFKSRKGEKCTPYRADGQYGEEYMIPAFVFNKWQGDNQPPGEDAIVLCPQWFQYWRSLSDVDADKKDVWGFIEFGFVAVRDELTFTSAFNLLHEILHIPRLYKQFGFPLVFQPGFPGERVMYNFIMDYTYKETAVDPPRKKGAYGARAAWCVNHGYKVYWDADADKALDEVTPSYAGWIGGLWNDDNYVSFVKEVGFQARYKDEDELQGRLDNGWLDPPATLEFPPGHEGWYPDLFTHNTFGQIQINPPVNGPDANTPANPPDDDPPAVACLTGC